MNEAQTRFNKIAPKLRDAGWGIVPGSNILVEQSAYISPGRLISFYSELQVVSDIIDPLKSKADRLQEKYHKIS